MWLKKVKNFLNDVDIERVRLATFQVLGKRAEISVSEINCPEPDCPPVKTVILIFQKNEDTQSVTIHKPLSMVDVHDVKRALHHRRDGDPGIKSYRGE